MQYQTHGSLRITLIHAQNLSELKFYYFILTISIWVILIQGFIPSLQFPAAFPILWRIFIFLACVMATHLFLNIWPQLPKQVMGFFFCLAAITALDMAGDLFARGLLSPAAFLPGIAAMSTFLYGWRRGNDPCALFTIVVVGAGIVASIFPIDFLRELTLKTVTQPDGSWIFTSVDLDIGRWHGISGNPDYAGLIAIYGLLVMLPVSRSKGFISIVVSVLLFCAILATASRSVAIALAVALVYLLFYKNIFMSRLHVTLVVGMLVLVLVGASSYMGPQINLFTERFSNQRVSEDSIQRIDTLISALRVTGEHPIFGVGKDDYTVTGGTRKIPMGAHIWFLEMSSQKGIPYAMLSGFLFLWIFILGRKAKNDILIVRYSGILIAILICGLSNGLMGLYLQWCFMGYSYGLYARYESQKELFRLYPHRALSSAMCRA